MVGSITTVRIKDPHEITPAMWERFAPTPTSAITPSQFRARLYRAGDWQRFARDRHAFETTVSVGKLGQICFVRMEDREATDMFIASPGLDHYCLTFLHRGYGVLKQRDGARETQVDPGSAVIFHGSTGTVLQTNPGAIKTNVWIPSGALHRQAAEMLEGIQVDTLDFSATIECQNSAGGGLQRVAEWIYDDLGRNDPVVSREMIAGPAQEMFLRAIVLAATHDRSAAIRRNVSPAGPVSVKRAEEFMRSNAQRAVMIGDIAQAAGCSPRALQAAFRSYRGFSPMAVLRKIRLELAHREVLESDAAVPVAEIAARYGFSNPGRFARQYQRAFGAPPSQDKGRPRER